MLVKQPRAVLPESTRARYIAVCVLPRAAAPTPTSAEANEIKECNKDAFS